MKRLIPSLLTCVTLGLGGFSVAATAFADHTYDYFETHRLPTGSFVLSRGELKTVRLDSWRKVKKVYISAYGLRGGATFEVIANGDVKGTIYVPGRDPNYVVTIGEVINSLQFRQVSGGDVVVNSISAVWSERYLDAYENEYPGGLPEVGGIAWPSSNQASHIARHAIRVVDHLQGYANYQENGDYLLPIKKVAARAYAAAQARGSMSRVVRGHLLALRSQILFAQDYLDEAFERERAFNLAVELLGIAEEIDAVLR